MNTLNGCPGNRGRYITDKRLREHARPSYPWLDGVYEETSRLVHLSEKHFQLAIHEVNPEAREASIALGGGAAQLAQGRTTQLPGGSRDGVPRDPRTG